MVYVVIFVLGLAYGVLGQGNSHHNDTSTNLRLVGGPSNATGLLQLMYHGEWVHFHSATSSSPYFTQMDAKVVCNMLGYGNRTAAYAFGPADGNKLFGSQQGRILVNVQFSCHGNETDLTQCSGWSNSFSLFTGYSGNDVAVTCDHTHIRLMDGDTLHSGRVEIFIQGQWHTICDNGFDDDAANVICNMLGSHGTGIAKAFRGSHFGSGIGGTVIQSLNCQGKEADIMSCSPAFGSYCSSSTAGVNCNRTSIRLVNGPTNTSGRVEVLSGGRWGTICGDSYFGWNAAYVICRMIGAYNPRAFAYSHAYYGEGNSNIIIRNLQCDGTESDISTCRSYSWAAHGYTYTSCSHSEDAGVNCDGKTPIQLADGVSEQSGRVEIFHNGHWGTVSSSGFDNHDLQVVCRMLGYEYSSKSFFMNNGYYGTGIGEVLVRSLHCNGVENDIGDCGGSWYPDFNSRDHSEDLGVNCDGVIPIRLVGGNATAGMGRVEIQHNSHYGTVCSKSFGRPDLMVVCRMLGFENIPLSAYWFEGHSNGIGETAVSHLTCSGIEPSIGHCGGYWPANGCTHAEDVYVNCLGVSETLRLVGGTKNHTGRVEVFHVGRWGTICDYSFGYEDAVVICRILGYQTPEDAVAYTGAHFGEADRSMPSLMHSLSCNGLETTLGQCNPTWSVNYCSHSHDVGVDCCPECQSAAIIG